jgi:hypothetical protein
MLTAKGLVAALDLFRERFRAGLGQRRQRAEAAGVGNGGGQLGIADVLHSSLHDRVFDAEHFGDARFDRHVIPLQRRRPRFNRVVKRDLARLQAAMILDRPAGRR